MRSRYRRFLFWSCPLLLVLGLLVLGGQRSAAAARDAAGADSAMTAEAADFLAFDEMQGGDAAQAAAPAATDKYGKPCTTNAQCPKKNYCAKGVGECKGKGDCKPKPEICPEIWKPVCGCDGKTHGNDCFAAAVGVNVKAEGACEKAVKCKSNAQCGTLEFCAKPDGKCDDEGICAKRPITLLCKPTDPVCGCDDKTYDGRCLAHKAGASIKHTGKCEK